MRNLLFLLFMCVALNGIGQTRTEEANRAVFNKIEFFINTQMTDSIYNMAADSFKKEVSHDQMAFMLQNLYKLGRITEVEVENFQGNTATYRVHFTQKKQLLANLAVDNTYHYTTLSFTAADPKDNTEIAEELEEEEVPNEGDEKDTLSLLENESPLDFYIDSIANTYINKAHTQSLAIAVFHNNQYDTFFYGETEKGNTTLPTEGTLYEIGSITKLFTATLLADLVTKDVIRLNDPIIGFLPDSVAANPALKEVTFETLANHTSGLPRMADNWNRTAGFNAKDPFAAYDQQALFSFLKNYKTDREPGEEYEYSNIGYGLLGELLATVCKKPYLSCLRETVLEPLQLNNTTDKPNAENELLGLDNEGNSIPPWNWDILVGAGGLKSNLRDLTLFAVEQFKRPDNELRNAMALTRQFTVFTPENMDIGLAWRISMTEDGIIYFHHTGGTDGSSSFIGLSPDTGTVLVILSNAAESVGAVSAEVMGKLLAE